MTPDEVVKELEILNQLTNIEWYGKEREAIQTATSLIQDYQKLRERIDVGKIARVLQDCDRTRGQDALHYQQADAIITYLQQPTEH